MAKVVKLPIPAAHDADEHARADTQRNQGLFAWADKVLKDLGLDRAVAAAKSIAELRKLTLDTDTLEVILAIRDALHPTSGQRQELFRGLKERGLKLILKNRFAEMKKAREAVLRRGTKQPDWTEGLILDKEGKIKPNLANLISILTSSPDWKGVLAFDEFAARVVIKRRPPFEATLNAAWTDHYESQTRVWFQHQDIKASAGDVGRAVQTAAQHNPFHSVRDLFELLVWDGVPRLDTWLVTYFHVEDTEFVRAIGPRYLISAVARFLNRARRLTTFSSSKVRRAG